MKRFIAVFYTFFLTSAIFLQCNANIAKAQDLSELDSVEISLLTCEAYQEIYGLYGHTAIRVNDIKHNTDLAINYGVFDKSAPNFILRFVLGLTDYTMACYPIAHLTNEYGYYGSEIKEQVLNLTREEKRNILSALDRNYLPENREYRYNFFYDNCATKPRDIILNNIIGRLDFKRSGMQQGDVSFRQLIHWKNHEYPWCSFGNDILLGVKADSNTSFEDREFLPDVLMSDFANATIEDNNGNDRPLVKETRVLIPHKTGELKPIPDFPLSPLCVSLIFTAITLSITITERLVLKRRIKGFDETSLFLAGIIGLLLFVMIFSCHPTVNVNFQIFLFNPLWLALAIKFGKKKWCRICIAISTLIFLIGGIFQQYAEGVLILACCLMFRTVTAYYDEK